MMVTNERLGLLVCAASTEMQLEPCLQADERVKELVEGAFSKILEGLEEFDLTAVRVFSVVAEDQMVFSGGDLERLENGFLSSLVNDLGITSIEDLVNEIMKTRSPSYMPCDDKIICSLSYPPGDPYGSLVKKLLKEILVSIKEDRPIVFNGGDLIEIHLVFQLLDYLGLDQLQDRQLEPVQEKFPDLAPWEFPSTMHFLTYKQFDYDYFFSKEERHLMEKDPKSISLSDKLPGLKHVKLTGKISNRVLAALPNHLLSLDCKGCTGIRGRGCDGMALSEDLALLAVSQDGLLLSMLSLGLKGNKAVALRAMAQNGLALQYVDYELRADKDVVITAMATDGMSLHLASEGLQADKDVVLAAVSQNRSAFQFASEELQHDPEILLVAAASSRRELDLQP